MVSAGRATDKILTLEIMLKCMQLKADEDVLNYLFFTIVM